MFSFLFVILGTMLLMDLFFGQKGLFSTIIYGLLGTFLSLVATISIDSVMWNKEWLWPEGKVLYYNIILNKSSNWGVSPWAWYFYSAIPRAMFVSTLLVPLGIYFDRRTLKLVVPSIVFVFLYSFLPHKVSISLFLLIMFTKGSFLFDSFLYVRKEKSV